MGRMRRERWRGEVFVSAVWRGEVFVWQRHRHGAVRRER